MTLGSPSIRSPLNRSAAPAQPASRSPFDPERNPVQPAVLLIEDDAAFQFLVRIELEDDGMSLADFVSIDRLGSALQLLAARKFDIVLTDLTLPDSNGILTFERLFAAAPETPIVVFSNQLDEIVAAHILRRGAQDYVQKGKMGRGALSRIILRAIERHSYATELDRRARLLAESERRFRLLVEHATDYAFVMLDPEGRVQTWNAGAERTVGFSAAESIGLTNVPFLSPDDMTVERQAALLARARTEGHARDEGWCQRMNGTRFWAEVALTAIRDDSGGLLGFVLLTHDLTVRKAAEKQRDAMENRLRSAQKLQAIGRLAAGIAHEINTPAQFIGHNLEYVAQSFARLQVLLGRLADGTTLNTADRAALASLGRDIPEALADTSEGIKRVARIVQAMKEFSHPGTQGENHPVLTDLNHAIETAITVAQHEWRLVAEVVRHFDPDLPAVLLFAGEFNQVLLNLLVNAAHAIAATGAGGTRGKGTITVSTGRSGDWLEVRIRDTGTGIPESIRHRLFEPFFTTKEIGEGTGQGLALAHAVVTQRHLGEISFETKVGSGSTFLLRLPLSDRNPRASA